MTTNQHFELTMPQEPEPLALPGSPEPEEDLPPPRGLVQFGAIEIDADHTWYLPNDWAGIPNDQVRDAWALTFAPPHPVDGRFGARMLMEIREAIEDVAESRGLALAPA